MHFYIRLKKNSKIPANKLILTLFNSSDTEIPSNQVIIIGKSNHLQIIEFDTEKKSFWILGDPIFHKNDIQYYKGLIENGSCGKFIREVDGFYYLLIWNKADNILTVGSSLFNILPIYYSDNSKEIFVSSSFKLIKDAIIPALNIDEQYYLEKAVFNYALFNRTPFKEIKTVPSNSLLEYNSQLFFTKHTAIESYFVKNPLPWRKSLESLSDLFIKQATAFLPAEKFCATFTGGFDGRTIIGIAKSLGLDFTTFSYGSAPDSDITVPLGISNKLGIHYSSILLDYNFANDHWWENANLFLQKSFGTGNLSRSQYHYTLKTLLKDEKYLLSGNFGSEIIRAMKVPGVMTSEMLFAVFEPDKRIDLRNQILIYSGLNYLSVELIKNNLDLMIEEINNFLSFLPNELSPNQKFYVYLYEEVFRKYFGPEIMVQHQILNHRAPFLSFGFIEELLKTEIAGANSNFRETNPLKRYRGQVLYAHILKKTYPQLLYEMLDRKYKPIDFLKPTGFINIMKGYIIKNYIKKLDKDTPSYSTLCIQRNLPKIKAMVVDKRVFNNNYLDNQINEGWKNDQMHFINAISSVIYYNILNNK